MTDYFYKFTDQSEALSVMADFTYTDDGTHFSQGGHQYALWEVGEINGYEGWHVNLRVIDESLDVSSLSAFVVTPINPSVVWA